MDRERGEGKLPRVQIIFRSRILQLVGADLHFFSRHCIGRFCAPKPFSPFVFLVGKCQKCPSDDTPACIFVPQSPLPFSLAFIDFPQNDYRRENWRLKRRDFFYLVFMIPTLQVAKEARHPSVPFPCLRATHSPPFPSFPEGTSHADSRARSKGGGGGRRRQFVVGKLHGFAHK